MFDTDVRLARFCRDRLGIIDREECARLGIDLRSIDRRIGASLLQVLHPGVYRHAACPATFEGDLLAAVKAAGPDAYASGPSAMRLYGIRGEWDEEPEITLVGTEHRRLRGVRVRRINALRPGDATLRFGIPVLVPPLALLLLGASAPPWKVETAVHDMVFQRHTTRLRLLDVLAAYGGHGRRGTTSFREAVASLDDQGAATQTNFELGFVHLLRIHGLPEPRLQLRVATADGREHRLDVAYPEQLVDLETDGDRWHLNPRDRARDRARDEALRAMGWDVHRFGSADVHLTPAATIATVRASLARDRRLVSPTCQRTA